MSIASITLQNPKNHLYWHTNLAKVELVENPQLSADTTRVQHWLTKHNTDHGTAKDSIDLSQTLCRRNLECLRKTFLPTTSAAFKVDNFVVKTLAVIASILVDILALPLRLIFQMTPIDVLILPLRLVIAIPGLFFEACRERTLADSLRNCLIAQGMPEALIENSGTVEMQWEMAKV